ncbi:AraC family transcriptional regulator [Streptomyces sp. GESEQ-4]|uniref:AraC family transcriptional regulator n=1 Tax=Streptomyces sp. GESEQ-4 TaxID=2812655 RepID=UPI001B326CEF|nr:AraC family transcriptional regulator [Streptomyces sp. GESEQ-4]
MRVGRAGGRLIRQSDSRGLRFPTFAGSGFHIVLRGATSPQWWTPATIARQVGYSTEFAFSAAFRREYGVSPARFCRTPTAVRVAGNALSEPVE